MKGRHLQVKPAYLHDGKEPLLAAFLHFRHSFAAIAGTQEAGGSQAGQDGGPAADNPGSLLEEVNKEFSSMEERLKGNMRVQKSMIERFGMSIGKLLSKHNARSGVVEQVTKALFETLPEASEHFIDYASKEKSLPKSPPKTSASEAGGGGGGGREASAAPSSPSESVPGKKRGSPSKPKKGKAAQASAQEELQAKGSEGPFGVGFTLRKTQDGQLVVDTVEWWAKRYLKETVLPGDVVTAVEGTQIEAEFEVEEVAGWLKHKSLNSKIDVTLQRGDDEPKTMPLYRKRPPITKQLEPLPTAYQKEKKLPKVLIIGAGAAGLACARQLMKDETAIVEVIEARDRTGGRIFSEVLEAKGGLAPSFVDLGASFVHGCDERVNPIFGMAKNCGARVDDAWGGYSMGWGERCDFYKDGKKVARKSVERAFEVLWGVHTWIKERAKEKATPRVKCTKCKIWRTFPEENRNFVTANVSSWTCSDGRSWNRPASKQGYFSRDPCSIPRCKWLPLAPEDQPLTEWLKTANAEVMQAQRGEASAVSKSRSQLVGEEDQVYRSGVVVAWSYVADLCDLALGQGYQVGDDNEAQLFVQDMSNPEKEAAMIVDETAGQDENFSVETRLDGDGDVAGCYDDKKLESADVETIQTKIKKLEEQERHINSKAVTNVGETIWLGHGCRQIREKLETLRLQLKNAINVKTEQEADEVTNTLSAQSSKPSGQENGKAPSLSPMLPSSKQKNGNVLSSLSDSDDDLPMDVVIKGVKTEDSLKKEAAKKTEASKKRKGGKPSFTKKTKSENRKIKKKRWTLHEKCEIHYFDIHDPAGMWYKGWISAINGDEVTVKYVGDDTTQETLRFDSVKLREPTGEDDDEEEDIPVTDGIVVEGYSNFLIRLLEKDVPVSLNTKVTGITVNAGREKGVPPVTVSVQAKKDGKSVSCTDLEADYCVVTLPLGVLQSGSVTFEPPLPNDKRDAIQSMGMGVENKIILRYTKPFWEGKEPYLQSPDVRFRFINGHYFGLDGVIIAHTGPPFSRGFDGLSDQQVIDEVKAVLKGMYGSRMNEAWYCDGNVTRWHEDEFAMGSYSYMKLGSHTQHVRALGASCHDGRLYFAGEACSLEAAQCVHGAYDTGQRAADAIRVHIAGPGTGPTTGR